MNHRLPFRVILFVCFLCHFFSVVDGQEPAANQQALFDGSFEGWEGDLQTTWRVENGAMIAGSLVEPAPRNEFICTKDRFSDFELTLRFKITGDENVNAGVQFRTERIPNHHEVSGYQADIGPGYHGALYDESRRNKLLASPDKATEKKALAAIPQDGWQTYRIRAVGNRIQLWLNGVQTIDYTETDDSISQEGIIAMQIHGGMRGTIAYDRIFIEDLSAAGTKPESDSNAASAD